MKSKTNPLPLPSFFTFLVAVVLLSPFLLEGVAGAIPVGTCYTGFTTLYSPVFGTVAVNSTIQKIADNRILFTAQPIFDVVVFCLRTFMLETTISSDLSQVLLFTDVCQAAVPPGAGFESLLPFCSSEGRYHVSYGTNTITFLSDALTYDNCTTRSSILKGQTFKLAPCRASCNCLEGPLPTSAPVPTPSPVVVTTPGPTRPPSPVWYPRLTQALCTPTTGGLVVLRGENLSSLNTYSMVNITIASVNCIYGGVLSSSVALCSFVPGIGAGYPVLVNANSTFSYGVTFSYCPPLIFSVQQQLVGSGVWQLTIDGTNFGWNPAQINLQLAKPGNSIPITCTNVSVINFHTRFTCIVTNPEEGQYFLTLTVGGQISPTYPPVSVIFSGSCYSKSGIDSSFLSSMLTQMSLKKSITRLKGLAQSLMEIKDRLPELEASSCCEGTEAYPLPEFELQLLSTDSLEFKDCIDDFCSNRQRYLDQL